MKCVLEMRLLNVVCSGVLQYEEEAIERGRKMLRMPPVKKAWEMDDAAKSHILSTDKNIYKFQKTDAKLVFTDITYGLPHRVSYQF